MTHNEISYIIRKSIWEVYNTLGPGLLERVYQCALLQELRLNGLKAETEVSLPVIYKGEKLDLGFRIDILVENKVIVELKAVESILPVHKLQLHTYLRLADKRLGILVNFNTNDVNSNIIRIINGNID